MDTKLLTLKPAYFFFKCFIKVYIACDKECAMATRVPNPISLYCTWKERLLNNLPFYIKHVFMYRRTHLAQSDEVYLVVLIEFRPRNVWPRQQFCVTWFFYTIWIGRMWRVKWRLVEVYRSKYGLVMAIYPIGCEEMATRRKKLSFRMVYNSIGNWRMISMMTSFEGEFNGE